MVTTSKSLFDLCAADIMSAEIVMIPREMSLQGAARLLARANVTGAPVVDASGRCIGVLSATDFMHWIEKDRKSPASTRSPSEPMCSAWQIPASTLQPPYCVEDCMTRDPVLVAPGTRIGELSRIMMDAHIHRVIVIEPATHRPIGIVSSMDILAALARVHQMQLVEDEQTTEIPVGAMC